MLCSDIDFLGFGMDLIFGPISVQSRQPVREQPDTGYWKSLLSYFAAAPGFWGGCGDGVVCFGGVFICWRLTGKGCWRGSGLLLWLKLLL